MRNLVSALPTIGRRRFLSGLALSGLALLLGAPAPALAQYDVPYVPTPQPVVDAMLDMAGVGAKDYVIDLGSGDGRIVITAASQFGARGLGVDLNPQRIKESNQNARNAGVTDKVEFRQADLFKTDITPATVLTMYLLPDVNIRLRPIILDTLDPGTRVVSHAFDMGDWEPDEERTVDGKRLFHWIVPAKVAGDWTLSLDGQERLVTLGQTYQTVTGSGAVSVPAGRLAGRDITLTVVDPAGRSHTLSGTVSDDGRRIQGNADGGARWSATRVGG